MKKSNFHNSKDLYETTLSYTGSILPTKSLITNGHYFFKSPRNIDLNNKKFLVLNKFEEKFLNNFKKANIKNDSSLVEQCLQQNNLK